MWKCKNCSEENEDDFDICWSCGYGINGKDSNKVQKEVEKIKKDINEKFEKEEKEELEKRRKKRRKIYLGFSLVFFAGFASHFLDKGYGINSIYKKILSVKYDVHDKNESKTISYDFGNSKKSCFILALNSSGEFREYIVRGDFKVEIFDKNDNLLKTSFIYHNLTTFPTDISLDSYDDYILYNIFTPVKDKYNLKIKFSTIKLSKGLSNIKGKVSLVLRSGCFGYDKEKIDEREKWMEYSIQRDEKNELLKPLFFALEKKDLKKIKNIFENGMDFNTKMLGNRTALHNAAYFDDSKTIEYLLDNGIDVNHRDKFGFTAIEYAIGNASINAIKTFIFRGITINTIFKVPKLEYGGFGDKEEILNHVASTCNYDLAKTLLENGININNVDKYRSNVIDIGIGATSPLDDINSSRCRGFWVSPDNKRNFKKLKKLFIEYGAISIREKVKNTLEEKDRFSIINTDKYESRKELLKDLQRSYFIGVKKTLDKEIGVNIKMFANRTPMHYSALYNDIETMKYLLSRNADLNVKDELGYTPIQYAIGNYSYEAVELLLENNVDVRNIKSIPIFFRNSLFFYEEKIIYNLVKNCEYKLTELLMKYGLDIKKSDAFLNEYIDIKNRKKLGVKIENYLDYLNKNRCIGSIGNVYGKEKLYKKMSRVLNKY